MNNPSSISQIYRITIRKFSHLRKNHSITGLDQDPKIANYPNVGTKTSEQ